MAQKPPAPSDLADKFMLRFPDGMRDQLKFVALLNNRSLNAEIIHRLSLTFEMDERSPTENAHAEARPSNLRADEERILEGVRKIIAEEMAKK